MCLSTLNYLLLPHSLLLLLFPTIFLLLFCFFSCFLFLYIFLWDICQHLILFGFWLTSVWMGFFFWGKEKEAPTLSGSGSTWNTPPPPPKQLRRQANCNLSFSASVLSRLSGPGHSCCFIGNATTKAQEITDRKISWNSLNGKNKSTALKEQARWVQREKVEIVYLCGTCTEKKKS